AERRRDTSNDLTIRGSFHPAKRIAEQLLDHAVLAGAAVGEQTSNRPRLGERGVRKAGNLARAVNRQVDGLGRRPSPRTGHLELDRFLVSPFSDGVIVLQAEADR